MEFREEGETVFEGRIFKVKKDQIRTKSGRKTTREVIEHPGSAAIVPLLEENSVLMVEQYRYAPSEKLLEIPAGTLEPGENPKECASRELIEETGYSAENFSLLAKCYTAPGYSDEMISIYLARDLSQVKNEPEEEGMTVNKRHFEKVVGGISEEIVDAKSIIGLNLAWQYIEDEESYSTEK